MKSLRRALMLLLPAWTALLALAASGQVFSDRV
jgi:hypothetical protein